MRQKGLFGLELLLVIAGIAVLAALMASQYNFYIKQAKMSEGLSLFIGARTHLSQHYALYGEYLQTDKNINKQVKTEGKYVSDLRLLPQGKVQLHFKDPDLPVLEFQPHKSSTTPQMMLAWQCRGLDSQQPELIPRFCR